MKVTKNNSTMLPPCLQWRQLAVAGGFTCHLSSLIPTRHPLGRPPPNPRPLQCGCRPWRPRPTQLPLSRPPRSPFRDCLLAPPPTTRGSRWVTVGFIQLWPRMILTVYLLSVPPTTQTPSPVRMGPVPQSLLFGCGGDFPPKSPQALDTHPFALWVCSCFLPGQVASTRHALGTRLGHVVRPGQSDTSRRSPGQAGRGQHVVASNGWLRRELTLDQREELSHHRLSVCGDRGLMYTWEEQGLA